MELTDKVATAIENTEVWNVFIQDDGAGPYIGLANPLDEDDYRCLSLTDEAACGDDLTKYHWYFWNSTHNVWLNSALGSDAELEAVLGFLSESLDEEAREIASKR